MAVEFPCPVTDSTSLSAEQIVKKVPMLCIALEGFPFISFGINDTKG
jgi:hypothetical protein